MWRVFSAIKTMDVSSLPGASISLPRVLFLKGIPARDANVGKISSCEWGASSLPGGNLTARSVEQERSVPCLKGAGQIGGRGEGRRVIQAVIPENGKDGVLEPGLFFRLFKETAQRKVGKAQGLKLFRTVKAIIEDLFRRGIGRKFISVALARNGIGAVEGCRLNDGCKGFAAFAEHLDGFLEQIKVGHAPYVHIRSFPRAFFLKLYISDVMLNESAHVGPACASADIVELS